MCLNSKLVLQIYCRLVCKLDSKTPTCQLVFDEDHQLLIICLNIDHLHQNEIKHNTTLKICQTTFVQFSNSRLHSAIKNLSSHTTKNLLSQTIKNLLSQTIKNLLSQTIKNLLSQTIKNLLSHKQSRTWVSHTIKNLLSHTIKNLFSHNQELVLTHNQELALTHKQELVVTHNQELVLTHKQELGFSKKCLQARKIELCECFVDSVVVTVVCLTCIAKKKSKE